MIAAIPMPDARLYVLEDAAAVAREGARRFANAAGRAVEASTTMRVALSGGSTPLGMYRLLASDETFRHSVHWPSVEFFWGDERFVPEDHAYSNYRAAREAMLGPLGIDPRQIHAIPTDGEDAAAAATEYESELEGLFGIARPTVPRFDLVLLGLGTDGHMASLFPGAIPEASDRLAVATRSPAGGTERITLTPSVLNAGREVLFLVAGEDKAAALEAAMRAKDPDPSVPTSLIRPDKGKITWLADRPAAANIVEPSGGGQG